MSGDQTQSLRNLLLSRSLEENIRDLNDTVPNTSHTLLLINHNSLMEDFFKGSIPGDVFSTKQIRLWESLFFFTGRLREADRKKLVNKLTGQENQTDSNKKTILFIAASPKDIANLQVNYEFNKIKTSLEAGLQRDAYELVLPLMSVTLPEFLQAKHKFRPTIIHFSGHGLQDGLMFSTDQNAFQIIPTELIKEIFKGIEVYTKIVMLNACYAATQAKIISENGIAVIGMNAPITDSAAIYLSEYFYRFIADGQSAEESFRNVNMLIQLNFPEESKTLEMWRNGIIIGVN